MTSGEEMNKQPQIYFGIDPAVPGKDYSCIVYVEDGQVRFCKNLLTLRGTLKQLFRNHKKHIKVLFKK